MNGNANKKLGDQTNEKQFLCKVCKKSFTNKLYLIRHVKVHPGELFMCQVCGKTYTNPKTYILHKKKHVGETVDTCPLCGLSIKSRGYLLKHLAICKQRKRWKCQICSKGFTQRRTLKYHMKSHSSGKKLNVSVEKCNQKSLKAKNKVKVQDCNNELGQTEKLYTCKVCQKELSSRRNLHQHEKIHVTSKKCIVCGKCGQQFPSVVNLMVHLKNIHRPADEVKTNQCKSPVKNSRSSIRKSLQVSPKAKVKENTVKPNIVTNGQISGQNLTSLMVMKHGLTKMPKLCLKKVDGNVMDRNEFYVYEHDGSSVSPIKQRANDQKDIKKIDKQRGNIFDALLGRKSDISCEKETNSDNVTEGVNVNTKATKSVSGDLTKLFASTGSPRVSEKSGSGNLFDRLQRTDTCELDKTNGLNKASFNLSTLRTKISLQMTNSCAHAAKVRKSEESSNIFEEMTKNSKSVKTLGKRSIDVDQKTTKIDYKLSKLGCIFGKVEKGKKKVNAYDSLVIAGSKMQDDDMKSVEERVPPLHGRRNIFDDLLKDSVKVDKPSDLSNNDLNHELLAKNSSAGDESLSAQPGVINLVETCRSTHTFGHIDKMEIGTAIEAKTFSGIPENCLSTKSLVQRNLFEDMFHKSDQKKEDQPYICSKMKLDPLIPIQYVENISTVCLNESGEIHVPIGIPDFTNEGKSSTEQNSEDDNISSDMALNKMKTVIKLPASEPEIIKSSSPVHSEILDRGNLFSTINFNAKSVPINSSLLDSNNDQNHDYEPNNNTAASSIQTCNPVIVLSPVMSNVGENSDVEVFSEEHGEVSGENEDYSVQDTFTRMGKEDTVSGKFTLEENDSVESNDVVHEKEMKNQVECHELHNGIVEAKHNSNHEIDLQTPSNKIREHKMKGHGLIGESSKNKVFNNQEKAMFEKFRTDLCLSPNEEMFNQISDLVNHDNQDTNDSNVIDPMNIDCDERNDKKIMSNSIERDSKFSSNDKSNIEIDRQDNAKQKIDSVHDSSDKLQSAKSSQFHRSSCMIKKLKNLQKQYMETLEYMAKDNNDGDHDSHVSMLKVKDKTDEHGSVLNVKDKTDEHGSVLKVKDKTDEHDSVKKVNDNHDSLCKVKDNNESTIANIVFQEIFDERESETSEEKTLNTKDGFVDNYSSVSEGREITESQKVQDQVKKCRNNTLIEQTDTVELLDNDSGKYDIPPSKATCFQTVLTLQETVTEKQIRHGLHERKVIRPDPYVEHKESVKIKPKKYNGLLPGKCRSKPHNGLDSESANSRKICIVGKKLYLVRPGQTVASVRQNSESTFTETQMHSSVVHRSSDSSSNKDVLNDSSVSLKCSRTSLTGGNISGTCDSTQYEHFSGPVRALRSQSKLSKTTDNLFHCDICDKSFKTKSSLRTHKFSHNQYNFVCQACGRGFFWEDHLERHMNVHLKTSTYIDLLQSYTVNNG